MTALRAQARGRAVFLNVPFDRPYRDLFVAFVAGLAGLGFTPRSVLEVETQRDRLRRLREIIDQCGASIHDLSRVELSDSYPRFNMPFEVGLVIGLDLAAQSTAHAHRRGAHRWILFETEPYRLDRTLSDLKGYEVRIHGAKPRVVLMQLRNDFRRRGKSQPSLKRLQELLARVMDLAERLEDDHGSLFEPFAFTELVYGAKKLAHKLGLA